MWNNSSNLKCIQGDYFNSKHTLSYEIYILENICIYSVYPLILL